MSQNAILPAMESFGQGERTVETIGIGIIGAGGIAAAHADAYRRCKRAELVAVTDASPQAAAAAAEKYSMESLNLEAFLANPRIEAVSICTPPSSHGELAMAALQAGKHVLLEKPVTVSLDEADRLIAVARAAGSLKAMVAHSHRFWPANQKAKELLDGGAIGDVIMVRDDILSQMRVEPGRLPWRSKREVAGGGVVMDNGVHALDRLRYWLGRPIAAVSGRMWSVIPGSDVEDEALALLTFAATGSAVEQGPAAQVRLSRTTPRVAGCCVAEFHGAKGLLRVETWGKVEISRGDADWETVPYDARPTAFDLEVEAFMASILDDRPVPVSLEEGRHSLAAVHAFYEAARTGRTVAVEDLRRAG